MQKIRSTLEIEIAEKKYTLTCDTDSPLGCLHDALMQMKGWCVDRMIANQKQEEETAKQMMEQETNIEE